VERPGNIVKSSGREAHVGRLSQPPSSKTLGVATVMLDSKRRSASTQAVSRKVEGIEPRNQVNRKDDGVMWHRLETRRQTEKTKLNLRTGSNLPTHPILSFPMLLYC